MRLITYVLVTLTYRTLSQNTQPMLLRNRQQLKRHAAWAFGAGLPFLDGAFAGVEIARKHRLAHAMGFAQLLDLFGFESGRR